MSRGCRAGRMLTLACAWLALGAGEPPPLAVTVQEFAYAQRLDYLLGDGVQPFADEDQRRVQILLSVSARGRYALLGWSGFAIDEALSDRGEPLAGLVGPAAEGVLLSTHDLKNSPTVQLGAIALPLTRQVVAGLSRLRGSVEIVFSKEPPVEKRFSLAELPPSADVAVPGLPGGTIAFIDQSPGRIRFRLSAAAFLALADMEFLDAAGAAVRIRSRKPEWRDSQGLMTYGLRGEPVAALSLKHYSEIERQRVPFAIDDLAFGFTVPGRDALRGTPPTAGAEGF